MARFDCADGRNGALPITAVWWLALQIAAADTPVIYFPPSLAVPVPDCRFGQKVEKRPVLSDFEARWYSSQLRAASEPSLSQPIRRGAQPKQRAIRFTWLRSFHPPIVVRIEGLETATPRMIAKQLSGAGGYAPGGIAKRVDRELASSEALTLLGLLADTHLDKTSSKTAALKECGPPGLDGAEWLVEVVDSRGYHFAKNWSPQAGDVRRMGLALIALTGWTVEPVY